MKKILYFILSVLGSAVFAIVFHKCLPDDANAGDADSFLVETFGFPVVACLYFVILFTLAAFAIYQLGIRSALSKNQVFLRFGIAYGLIYFVGMFEIAPGTDWNLDVLIPQVFVGIGDAVPGFLIAFLISRKVEGKPEKPTKHQFDYRLMLLITVCLFVVRMIGYTSGLVLNSMDDYCILVIAWTLLFSILAGISIGILHPFYRKGTHFSVIRFLLSFGCNWLCFNGFIGLIWKDFWAVIFIRVAVDLLAILLGIGIYQKLPKKPGVTD